MTIEATPELRQKCRDTIRFLAADAVEKANSGHPGTPMGAADIAFVIWTEVMKHDPSTPDWPNRDRFVLSGGHASMLLYSMLHLSGYDLPLEELKRFRQWGSKTPGHPEVGFTVGVECTTGPLGGGFATAVGMALAAKMHAARFNTAQFPVIDSHIIGICGDGDMQEGVTAEAASLAGHLGLGNLIFVYDNNDITIEGHLDVAMGEDVGRRFEAIEWFVQHVDGHDQAAIKACMDLARAQTIKPSLIIAKTVIGAGAPTKAGTHAVHGAPLGTEELAGAKANVGWPNEMFHVPGEVRAYFAQVAERGQVERRRWESMMSEWRSTHPARASLWDKQWSHAVPDDFLAQLEATVAGEINATRSLSGALIQKATSLMPALIGGAADLEPSTKTGVKGAASVVPASVESDTLPDASFAGQNLHFGIREHAMGWMANGMLCYGGWRTYNATFLVFSDYMRAPVRIAALSHLPTIFVFTHDSFWVGEDGPTHQPIEHVWSLRLIPNHDLWRPADATETAIAWYAACTSEKTPNTLILTRQKTAELDQSNVSRDDILKGGYILADASGGTPAVTIIATGSEVGVALDARASLEANGTATRVVSIPCWNRFDRQSDDYKLSVIPRSSRRVAIEAGRTAAWYQYVGDEGLVIGIDHFGASAPGPILEDKFGFSAEKVIARINGWLN
jgi:transketolase